MKPIYFPFTFVSKQTVNAICSFFPQIVVYQPSNLMIPKEMDELIKNNAIEMRVPIETDEEKISSALINYKHWIQSHDGAGIEFLKAKKDTLPFFDESSTHQIKADIKQKKSQQKPDPVFNARLFLSFAQEFDEHQMGVMQTLKSCKNMEKDLFHALKGETDDLFSSENEGTSKESGSGLEDLGNYMTEDRIAAWTRLMLDDDEASGLFFITGSRAVFDDLMEKTPNARQLFSYDSMPADEWSKDALQNQHQNFMKIMDTVNENPNNLSKDSIAVSPNQDLSPKKVSLTICVSEGESPNDFFARCSGIQLSDITKRGEQNKIEHTFFGIID